MALTSEMQKSLSLALDSEARRRRRRRRRSLLVSDTVGRHPML